MKKIKYESSSEKGQALIELIIFLPLIITIYSVVGGYASAINGSINQQKITRAYFYARVQNNSNIPGPSVSSPSVYQAWSKFGMFFIGWKDYFQGGNTPVMPCYRVNIPFKNSPAEKCEDAYSTNKSLYVRIGTVYGVCGATWINNGGFITMADPQQSVDLGSCIIK